MSSPSASPKPTDDQLVAAALRDAAAFGPLIERYEQPLLHFILRSTDVTLEAAQDLLQESFLKIWRYLNAFDGTLSFKNWAYRLTRQVIISAHRAAQTRGQHQTVSVPDLSLFDLPDSTDLPSQTDTTARAQTVRQALQTLPPAQRQALVLHYFENLSYSEISDILQRPPGTIATLLHRAKATLRPQLTHLQLP